MADANNCQDINFSHIDSKLFRDKNVVYGAGYNGKLLFEKLKHHNVPVFGFFDDDESRWGEMVYDTPVLSCSQLMNLDISNVNIIISSMYIDQMSSKISKKGFKNIWIALDMLLEKDERDFKFIEYKDNVSYKERLGKLNLCFEDELSKKYYSIILNTVEQGKATKEICGICSKEKQYFLSTLREKIKNSSFVDAGAYNGDTLRELIEENFNFDTIYCFEANATNFIRLQKFVDERKLENVICENKAIWNQNTYLSMKFENYNSRIDEENKAEKIQAITLDEYFENRKIGFLKMDIEGAEMKALKGGEKVILRDRPILAISIYHGLDDIVEIPEYLMKRLARYTFFVRHHSFTYSETVLYGVPNENMLENGVGN